MSIRIIENLCKEVNYPIIEKLHLELDTPMKIIVKKGGKQRFKMKITAILLLIVFSYNYVYAQVERNLYQLNSMQNLLTKDVKAILDKNLNGKKVAFLGESNHHYGSDLLAKTEFVKYLVLEKGFKDIVFESDFFGLYFDHNKRNLYPFWSNSAQCEELFKFLKEHNVTIWGFDNQLNSPYTSSAFSIKLNNFLIENSINVDKRFIDLTEAFFKNKDRSNSNKIIGKLNLEYLTSEIDTLLKNEIISRNKLWFQFLESYKSYILINSTAKTNEKGIPIRDKQMAKNLNFIINSMPEKKFIVWLHNAHMIKDNYGTKPGQTMGFQFEKSNPNISYRIVFSSIYMPFIKPKRIKKYSNDEDNLLNLLPTTKNNYFIDSREIINESPKYQEKEYEGMFVVDDKNYKTNWFKHYDALVFISKGEFVNIKK